LFRRRDTKAAPSRPAPTRDSDIGSGTADTRVENDVFAVRALLSVNVWTLRIEKVVLGVSAQVCCAATQLLEIDVVELAGAMLQLVNGLPTDETSDGSVLPALAANEEATVSPPPPPNQLFADKEAAPVKNLSAPAGLR
jgi:hypothetical protein